MSNGDKYEGQWQLGEKNGKGIYEFANSDRYEGYWMKSKFCLIEFFAFFNHPLLFVGPR